MSLDFSTDFVLTSLRVGKHVDGLIDSYFGPSELSDMVNKESLKPLDDILSDIGGLEEGIKSWASEKPRRTYLEKQIRALKTIVEQKTGKDIPYRELVRRTLDVEPKRVKEKEILKIRQELQELLTKNGYLGNLTEMIATFRKKSLISGKALAEEFDTLIDTGRGRTRAKIRLPPSELVELSIVADKPWGAYNWYLGGYRSRIDLNTDLPMSTTRLQALVAHEAYPGHHTEHASKELELFTVKRQLESSLLLINTPECTISEGLADVAGRFILGERSAVDDRIQDLAERLRGAVNINAALMMYDKHIDVDATKEYYLEVGATPKDEVDKRMRFILDPLWRGYIFSYHEGAKLVEEAWKKAKEARKEEELLKILYKEENCPTTFEEKVREHIK